MSHTTMFVRTAIMDTVHLIRYGLLHTWKLILLAISVTKMLDHYNPEDWILFENTQEPIVDEDTWYTVQKIRETKHKPSKRGEPNPLTGLMFCADCGAKMFNHRTGGYEKKDKDGNPTGKYTNAQDAYHCSTYSLNKGKFVDSCSMHHVRTDVVRDLILETLKATAGFVREHGEEFAAKVRNESTIQRADAAKALQKKLSREQKRTNELNQLIKKIYENNVTGRLTDKRFEMLLFDYEQEQASLEICWQAGCPYAGTDTRTAQRGRTQAQETCRESYLYEAEIRT